MFVRNKGLGFDFAGSEQRISEMEGKPETLSEVGWFILGENQQHLGPYAFSELRGEFVLILDSYDVYQYGLLVWNSILVHLNTLLNKQVQVSCVSNAICS